MGEESWNSMKLLWKLLILCPYHSSGWKTRLGNRGPAAESCLLSTIQTAPWGPAPSRGEMGRTTQAMTAPVELESGIR